MSVDFSIKSRKKDLGGFSVRRLLPSVEQKMIGPWIFFDHLGPATFPAGEGINVRPHPHINLATVTYLFEGEILHRDSLGTEQIITPGDINLMVAGHGIVHSERQRDEIKSTSHNVHALQLWHALPVEFEEMNPEFFHYSKNEIPTAQLPNGINVKVIMGSVYGVTSPVKTYCKTLFVETELKAGDVLDIPNVEQIGVYVVYGKVRLDDCEVSEHQMSANNDFEDIKVNALEDSHIIIIGGERIGDRKIFWNFVSSNDNRIEQAKEDWCNMNFPEIPNDNEEFIPLPGDK